MRRWSWTKLIVLNAVRMYFTHQCSGFGVRFLSGNIMYFTMFWLGAHFYHWMHALVIPIPKSDAPEIELQPCRSMALTAALCLLDGLCARAECTSPVHTYKCNICWSLNVVQSPTGKHPGIQKATNPINGKWQIDRIVRLQDSVLKSLLSGERFLAIFVDFSRHSLWFGDFVHLWRIARYLCKDVRIII